MNRYSGLLAHEPMSMDKIIIRILTPEGLLTAKRFEKGTPNGIEKNRAELKQKSLYTFEI